jgi:predicted DNA-binding protein (MmcQ/YjbR family)
MIDFASFALSFPGAEEKPHFERRSFRVVNRRIFATLHESSHTANLRLIPEDQQTFCDFGPSVYPVPNKSGEQGWTTFELNGVPEELIQDALEAAYNYAREK